MEQKKLNVGVFGGARGNVMIKALLHHPFAKLVAVCDKYVPLLERAKKNAEAVGMEIACYESFDDFIKHPELDAVVLANYANEHGIYAVRCLRAGKHVLSEVLPCETMAQAVELIEAVEETGLVYAYAENYCYMRQTFEMWRRYRTGVIGEVKYAEGNYVHDCSSIWPSITYGDPNHWRNLMHATFYCTHSLGPLMTITGLRPKSVTGFEIISPDSIRALGRRAGSGMEIVTMENGAIFKSIHGPFKREPSYSTYTIYGNSGAMESGLNPGEPKFNLYVEGEQLCKGEWERYDPDSDVARDMRKASGVDSHSGSDFYPTHCFIEKILGREDGKWSIDVYTAIDMGICGILAYRSILNGNTPVAVPNLRNKEERDAYRHDHACTNPAVAGDALLPVTTMEKDGAAPSAEVYERVREMWLKKNQK
jgi:predicted dehydrogenase